VIRLLKQATAALVEQNWLLISALASELERSKEMDQAAVARYANEVPAANVGFLLKVDAQSVSAYRREVAAA
jgi:hypothetical protein